MKQVGEMKAIRGTKSVALLLEGRGKKGKIDRMGEWMD
jgi:hypothetical protein